MSDQHANNTDGPVVPENRAKQGRRGVQVFVVLAGSLVLALIAAIFLGIFNT